MTKINLTDERIKVLIDILDIKRSKKRGEVIYKTRWGDKTERGLIETIKNTLNETKW